MADVSVFIDSSTYKILQDLSAQTGRKTEEIVNKAVELYRRKLLLDKTNAAFTALKADSQAWKEEQEERATWDVTLLDGLKDN